MRVSLSSLSLSLSLSLSFSLLRIKKVRPSWPSDCYPLTQTLSVRIHAWVRVSQGSQGRAFDIIYIKPVLESSEQLPTFAGIVRAYYEVRAPMLPCVRAVCVLCTCVNVCVYLCVCECAYVRAPECMHVLSILCVQCRTKTSASLLPPRVGRTSTSKRAWLRTGPALHLVCDVRRGEEGGLEWDGGGEGVERERERS